MPSSNHELPSHLTREYPFILARPYMCVGAVVEAILRRRGITAISQMEVAEFLGICLPPGAQTSISNVRFSDDPEQWGMSLSSDGLNRIFDSFGVPLEERFTSASTFEDWEFVDRVTEGLVAGFDLACGYEYCALHGTGVARSGHVSIIAGMQDEDTFVLQDPGPQEPGLKHVSATTLYGAIRKREDGLWAVYPKS